MLYNLTTRVACISRLVLAVVALVAIGAAPAGADQCTRAKLKAIGKKESGLLACQAKVAARGDSSGLSACESKVMAQFSHAFGNAGTCMGDQTVCESVADGCVSSVAGAFIDTFPSDCEARKRKAAGNLAKRELGCYAKAATKGLPVDSVVCISKSTMMFSVALTKAGTCPDGGSPQGFLESHCVTPAVTTDGGGVVTDVCPTTTTTTTTLPCTLGQPVGNFCWFLGAFGADCDATCAAEGRVYDAATATYAGSSGTNANCEAVLTALGHPGGVSDASLSVGGIGCSRDCFRFGCPGFREIGETTTSGASFAQSQRACACM
jgi:hypothetical protein